MADGQFRVFGKVVRAVFEEGQSIDLLRNTKFAHIPTAFDALKPAFAATKQSGVTLPEIVTEIQRRFFSTADSYLRMSAWLTSGCTRRAPRAIERPRVSRRR